MISRHSIPSPIAPPTLLAYSLPYLVAAFLNAPVAIMQGVYAKHFGLPLTTLAAVLMFARFFDGVIDPVIGYLSDRERARTGSRKPLMIAGSFVFLIGGYLLYSPPSDFGGWYLACAFVVFYIGWTMLEVPYLAWGGELAGTSLEKAKIFSYRAGVGYCGLLAFYALPMLPSAETTEITPQTLRWVALTAVCMMPPCLYIAVRRVPDGERARHARAALPTGGGVSSRLQVFTANRPFLILVAAYATAVTGSAMWYGLIFTYVDAYLGLGTQFAQMFMLSFAVGIVCTPAWYKVIARLGREPAWGLAVALMVASFLYTGALTPGETTFTELLTLKTANTLGFVGLTILIPALLAETVDYGTWKFGVNRGASYFGAYTLSIKLVNALGAALALAIAGSFGFEPAAKVQTAQAVFGMSLGIVWVPSALMIASMVIVMLLPLDARRHEIIRRRLQAREIRKTRREQPGEHSVTTQLKAARRNG